MDRLLLMISQPATRVISLGLLAIAVLSTPMLALFQARAAAEVALGKDIDALLEVAVSGKPTAADAKLTVSLINHGSRNLWVNSRMLLNSPHAPRSAREIWLEIEGPHSRKIDFRCKVRAGQAKPAHYQLLKPQERASINVGLSQCFDLHEAGLYTIYANYQDGSDSLPPPPEGALPLREHLRSSGVTLEIVPEATPLNSGAPVYGDSWIKR